MAKLREGAVNKGEISGRKQSTIGAEYKARQSVHMKDSVTPTVYGTTSSRASCAQDLGAVT